MSKEASEIKPNYAPVYAAAMYPKLCPIFHKHGYALAVHGSVSRDFDLIAVPWAKKISNPKVVIQEVMSEFSLKKIGRAAVKNHGRRAYVLHTTYGSFYIDLSFFPKI